jgi:Cys-rich protein (TIGR01571 family)
MTTPTPATSWKHNICSCDDAGTCCAVIWCGPCIFGRTDHRLTHFPHSPEESNFSWCNSSCMIMCCALTLLIPGLPLWMQRDKVRQKFGVRGGGCIDCLATWCLPCCTQIQQDNELQEQARLLTASNAANNAQVYQQQDNKMVYGQQNGQQPMQQTPPAY